MTNSVTVLYKLIDMEHLLWLVLNTNHKTGCEINIAMVSVLSQHKVNVNSHLQPILHT